MDWLKTHFYWLILFMVVLSIGFISAVTCSMSSNDIDNEKNTIFQKYWEYSVDGIAYRPVSLPYSESETVKSHLTLKNRLPDDLVKGATVLLRTSQQDVRVMVDGTEIYDSEMQTEGVPMSSSAYHFVRVPIDSASKEITVVLTSSYPRYAGIVNQIYIGSKASHIFFLLHENGFHFLIGFLLFSVGILVIAMFLFVKGGKNKVPVIYLGAFFACAGWWLLVESHMVQFIIPYPVALTNTSVFALTLLPVFLGLYYSSTHKEAFKRVGKCIVTCMIIASFGLAVLSGINPSLPVRLFPLYLIFMGAYVTILLLTLIIENRRAGKAVSLSTRGGIAFGSFCLLEIIFYLRDIKNYANSNFLTVGLFLFCILILADTIRSFARLYQSAIKVNTLTILAYTDSLTGFKNRRAFLERMAELDANEEDSISFAMFDINNLKMVNDSLGHLVGDAMLRHSAKSMKGSLRKEDELYRIGGDEFAAIICHEDSLDFNIFEERLSTILKQENQKLLSYTLSVAYGYATFSKDKDNTLFDTLARADERMYARKKIQKGEWDIHHGADS